MVRLTGEEHFQPASTFAVSAEQAKALLSERFSGQIVEWKVRG